MSDPKTPMNAQELAALILIPDSPPHNSLIGKDTEHSGDCTKECHTCLRCQYDEIEAAAVQIEAYRDYCRAADQARIDELEAEVQYQSAQRNAEYHQMREQLVELQKARAAERDYLMDPIVRAKMLEPPPPIMIESAVLWKRVEAAEAKVAKLRETLNTRR